MEKPAIFTIAQETNWVIRVDDKIVARSYDPEQDRDKFIEATAANDDKNAHEVPKALKSITTVACTMGLIFDVALSELLLEDHPLAGRLTEGGGLLLVGSLLLLTRKLIKNSAQEYKDQAAKIRALSSMAISQQTEAGN